MIQVMGESFANRNIGTYAAVQKIMGMRQKKGLDNVWEEVRIIEQVGTNLDVDPGTPGKGMTRPEQRKQNYQYGDKKHLFRTT